MKHRRSLPALALLAILGLSTSAAWAQVVAVPTPPPPPRGRAARPVVPVPAQPPVDATAAPLPLPAATAPLDPFAKDLLTRLNSPDNTQRSTAEDQLKSITGLWQQPELLQKMIDATTDPELKEALQQRLIDVKNRLAMQDLTHLPNISLHVSGANMSELVTALNRATGAPNAIGSNGGGGSFTLDVTDKPFWEVYAALSQQQPLNLVNNFNPSAGSANLMIQNGGSAVHNFAVSGPVYAYFNTLNFNRRITLQTPNGAGPVTSTLSAQLMVAVDPRIKLAGIGTPTAITITDDTGQKLPVASFSSPPMAGNICNFSMNLNLPETFGKSMAIAFDMTISAATNSSTVTLNDVEHNVGKQVTAGGRSISVSRFEPNGATINFQINANNNGPMMAGDPQPRTPVVLLDASGRQLWSGTVTGSLGTSISAGTGPYKLEISVADKSVNIPVHLSFKDVPLP